ncbi:arylsulfatase [Pedobacter nutrimenti]|uniref:Arylsulfatase A-like enzyme n=1 Tax=Pedobacter nutrimenti TaxID=1241337 RepID=A0A318UQQ7_9SPHI|nr:arylsulfatase [Pedobacter nutrimenti]PYF77408.1 arylsulfatase A-like enzyme [Pedobacter nutrimenti]
MNKDLLCAPEKKIRVCLSLLAFMLLAFANASFAQKRAAKAVKKQPNIIYIYADDLGYAETGPYGQTKIKTPHLDRMAREGMKFTQHYSGAPVCAPARCMLMTGKNGGHAYIRGNYGMGGSRDEEEGGQMPLPEGTFTIPKMLKNAGYATGMIGKWGLGMNNSTGSPLKQGFDFYYGYLDQKQAQNYYPTHLWENDQQVPLNNSFFDINEKLDPARATDADFERFKGKEYAPDKMTSKGLAFIEQHRSGPFFLYMAYTLPHVSLQVPERYIQPYLGQFDEQPYYGQQGYAPCKYPLSTYAGMISYLDEQVGLVMDKIKQLGLDENTIILFSSDNGTTFNGGVQATFFKSVANLRGLKMDVFEGGIREPFIVRWPGKVPANTSSDLISAQFDMMPTFAELSGARAVHPDGISLLPTFLGKPAGQQNRPYLYFEYPEKGGQVAIRMGKWKAVKLNMQKQKKAEWQLFDLSRDISEQLNLAPAYPGLIRELEEIVKKEHQSAHINEWEFVDSKMKTNSASPKK